MPNNSNKAEETKDTAQVDEVSCQRETRSRKKDASIV